MNIASINAASAAAASAGQTAAPKPFSGFGGSDFMLMLMAQLRNQNPLDPMQDKDLMGQVTQLNSLQELQGIKASLEKLASSNQLNNSASLIGKTVKVDLGDGETFEGLVSGVSIENGTVMVAIGEDVYPMTAILGIK